MNKLSEIKWHCSYPHETVKVEVVIIPKDVKDRMAKVTTRDLYIWGRKNGVIKRLPRKVKKRLYYGKSIKYEPKATIACVNLWNEYDEKNTNI